MVPAMPARRAPILHTLLALCSLTALAACARKSQSAPSPGASGPPLTQALEVEGVKVQVPASFVPLEPERVDRLAASAEEQEPGAEVSIVGARAPTSMSQGAVYVQRSAVRRPVGPGPATVREALVQFSRELQQASQSAGAVVAAVVTRERDQGLEICMTVALSGPTGEVVAPRVCSLLFLGANERLRALVVNCMAPDQELCRRILETRRYAVKEALPYSRPLTRAPDAR